MTQTTEAPPAAPQPKQRSQTRQVVLMWVVLTILLELFALFVPAHLMGAPASNDMIDIENSMTVFSVTAAPVAALVWAIAIYSLLRWRHRGSGPPDSAGAPIRTNVKVVAVWTAVSSLLCLFLFIWGEVELSAEQSSAAASNGTVIDVTGQQWAWTFSYPGAGGFTSDVLYLPVNKPVTFRVTSEDVVHSFWVVQLGTKIDANPGETTTASVTPDKLGTYAVRCAELCGIYHAYMEAKVHVVSASDFRAWLKSNKAQG
ncbi:MAG: cytochrome c oxidase subunit II [Streptosporangiales bacterium]|nr:cytochrome c oxidase subunit II [Streptosporangiales bacterium]